MGYRGPPRPPGREPWFAPLDWADDFDAWREAADEVAALCGESIPWQFYNARERCVRRPPPGGSCVARPSRHPAMHAKVSEMLATTPHASALYRLHDAAEEALGG